MFKCLFPLLLLSGLLLGCSKGGGGSSNNYFIPTPSTPATITVPTGADTIAQVGVPYSFEVTVSGVNGIESNGSIVGSFSATFGNTTGTANFAGLSVTFTPIVQIGFLTFRSVGTVSGPFTGEGTIGITVTYTEPQINIVNNSASFFVTVPPTPATLVFSPAPPLNLAAGSEPITIQGIGSPSGGTYSFGAVNGGTTGGTFSLVSPNDGTFTFGGTLSSGTATIDIVYTPPFNLANPVTEQYTVIVSDVIIATPPSPLGVLVGSPPINIQALGSPPGGVFGLGTVSPGLTGGSFSVNSATGQYTFSGTTNVGTATAEFTYTPPFGGATAVLVYRVDVSNIAFAPFTPTGYIVGAPDLEISVIGTPTNGLISFGVIDLGTTGGVFTILEEEVEADLPGVFSFGSATDIGTATVSVIYTPPGAASVALLYTVEVSDIVFPLAPQLAASGTPTPRVGFALGDPDLTIPLTGRPAGGTFSFGSTDTSQTGGAFTLTNPGPTNAAFTFGGPIGVGVAIVQIFYTPPSGIPGGIKFRVFVSDVQFFPPPILGLTTGAAPQTITAIGNPPGGVFAIPGFNPGTTGGAFNILDSAGFFSFSGSTGPGTAVTDLVYTPPGAPPITVNYTVETVTLLFSPDTPLEVAVGDGPVTITASGLRAGGQYSSANFVDFGTGGSFSNINPVTGEFTFSGALVAGSASIDITYITAVGTVITRNYEVIVSDLLFSPPPPLDVLGVVGGSAPVTITVLGGAPGGSIMILSQVGGGTGGTFAVTGSFTFSFSGATTGGQASAVIRYVPPFGASVTRTYTVNVTSLNFSPVSPRGVTVNASTGTITAIGLPGGGVYSGGNVADPGTGGVFSTIDPILGTFTFSGASRAGSATTSFTYDPPVGATITMSYTVVVTSLEFSPPSPLAILAGDSATITAIGEPNSPVGVYSRTVVSLGGTGLVVSAINANTGVFTVSGATAGGTATINVTFTPAVSGSVPITLPYVVNVTSMTIASTTGNPGTMRVGDAPVTITATGLPTGGTYSGGGFTDFTTFGQFSAINPTTGVLTYSSPIFGGTATVNITYTPSDPNFLSITLPFSVFVTSLVVTPASPLAILANSGTTTLTAFGLPNPGTYSRGALSDPQGTGVSISAINPTTGVMTVDGSTATLGGTATFTITYTPALPSVPLTITYTIIVTSLTFSPVSPAGVSVISGPLTVTATGLTAGGVYSGGNVADPITGGVFSLINPTTGVFTFSGAFRAGSATTTFTYDPPVGLTITLSYTVVVSSLEFSPPSPLAILAGDSATITAIGEPNSPVGLYSRTVVSLGGTGLVVSAINPTTGVFTVSGATTGGTATINVTFTPALSGSVPITLPYVVNVTSMTIASTTGNPGTMLVGDAPVTITATGLPTGGTYSGGGFTDLTTLGQFSAINPTTGVLTYSSPLFGGTATVNITYTPSDPNFLSITLPFSVFVTSLVVAPASPLAILVGSGTTTLTAFGLPNPGTYSVSALSDPQGTGVTISAINPTTGVMTVIGSTATSGGTATFTITYTPALPSLPITITYTIVVTSLTFSPTSPAGFAVGSAPLTITATGLPAGGVYSNGGGSFDPLTKGTFSAIDSLSGVFTFSGAIEPGTASISVTYTPDPVTSGIPITLVYQVTVTRLTFTPSNPIALAVGDPDVLVRAVGEPAGGLYSLGAFTDGGTGVTLSAINALTGEFTVFNTSTTGGVASVPVTYDPDAGGPLASATVTFVINVTSLTFAPAPILELDVGVSSGTITATGLPTGGTYSGGGFVNPDTGGLFSTIHPTAGTFTFTGSTTGGIATVAITYTPAPASGFKAITVVYTVEVSALTFIPPSPLAVVAVPVVGSAPVTVTAVGDPSGGSYAVTAIVQADASHMFSAIDSVTGEFTFFGATVAGQSTITVEYTPPGGIGPVSTGTYTVNVSSMTFAPASPLEVLVGGAPATVTVTGTAGPAGGFVTFAAPSVGGTGGIFITPVVPVVSPATFTFDPSGATAAGVETIEVTFTPSNAGWAPVTLVYTVNVRTILFLPATPLTFPFASPIFPSTEIPDATITAIGLPGGGTFSFGTITTPTGGAFNLVSAGPGTGTFLFGDGDEGGAFPFTPLTSTGTSTVEIVYTPLVGSPVIVLYTVNVVAAVTFNVPNPYEIVAGSPTFTAVALGQPPGGTYAFGTLTSSFPGTGGSFTAIDPVTGIFFFGGSTSAGFETIEVLYTPVGALVPVSASFTVLVSNIVFSPTSTAIYDLISITPLTVTATGGQPGGLFFITAVDTTDTGGTFTLTSSGPTVGTFTFASPTSTGLASVQITYLPPVGSGPPVSITYFVRVINPKVICATPIVRIPTVGNSGFVVPAPTITVIDAPDEISDLNVFFFINHGRTGQVELTLTSPAGISVVITIDGVSISPPGGFPFPDGYAGVTFDDEAPLPLSALGGPGGGLFQPIGLLSAFDGTDGNGTWILTVEDNSSAPGANPAVGTGTLVAWCLIFDNETFVAPPVAATSFSFADSLGVAPPIGIAFPLGGVNSTLAAGDMFSFTVAGGPSRLIDLDVLFDMTHGRPSQVGLLDVTGPTAATSRLIPDGGLMLGAVFSTSLSPIFFDDTGGPPITNYSTLGPVFPPAPGTTFAPSTPLSVFTGTDPNGLWTLAIRDNSSGAGALGTGTFDEWVLEMVGFTDVYLSGTPPGTTVTDTNVLIDTIEVPIGAPLIATDFRLAVSILHPDLSELDVFVRFRPDDVPVPVLVPLFTPGTVTGIDMGVIFDDTAASIATFTGSPGNPGPFASFSPTGTLATFVGIDPAGEWDLIITDTTAGNDGTLVFWGFAIDGEFFPSPIE